MKNPIKNLAKDLKIKRKAISRLAAWHFYGNPSIKLKIIGVTGTNGKTTTTTLLYKIATALGHKAGLIGTVENIIVDEHREALRTTPSPINLNNLLKEMVENDCEYVFMEVSSHAMHQGRVAGINFMGGIFTNLTQDHLDYHGNMENYFKAKKNFFQMLPIEAFALSNGDDEYGMDMLEGLKAKKFLYGFDTDVDFKGKIKKIDFLGLELDFNNQKVHSKLLGKFNAYNLLAVWSACSLLGFDMKAVNKILEEITPPKGRFDYFTSDSGVLVVIDYAHTPDALEKIILAVKEVKPKNGKLITVFGCGGDRDPLKRPIMGKIGAKNSDIAIFTSDNPRSENREKIIEEMKKDLSTEELNKVKTIPKRLEAIYESVKLAQKEDVIICAGKGHETYQEIKGVKNHFDDMEEYKKLF